MSDPRGASLGIWRDLEFRVVQFFPTVIVLAAGLAPIVWLDNGLILKTVDSFFAVYPRHLLGTALYTWQTRSSTGVAAYSIPSIPLVALQQGLFMAGVPLVVDQSFILVTLAMAAVIGATWLMGEAIGNDHPTMLGTRDRFICAVVGVEWVANPFALSFVWFHQLQTEVTWAVLPWLVLVVIRGARGSLTFRQSSAWLVILCFLGAAGLPHIYIPSIGLVLLIMGISSGTRNPHTKHGLMLIVGLLAVFVGALAVWIVPSLPLLHDLVNTGEIGAPPLTQLRFASRFTNLANVLSLTAVPALHQGVSGTPYMSWSWLILQWPGNVLRFILPVVAGIGSFWGIRQPATRRIAVGSTVAVVIGALFSKGINQPFPIVSIDLLRLPFGAGYTYPLDKFALVLVVAICLLFGLGLRAILESKRRSLAIPVVLVTGVWLALPWWDGQVIPAGGGVLPSAHVSVPKAYVRAGMLLARQPLMGKTFVVPYQPNGGTAFSWAHGVQPNLDCLLEDWTPGRSVICVPSGQPYGDRVGPALNAGLRNSDPRVLALAKLWGIDTWVIHRDWASNYMFPSVSPTTSTVLLSGGVYPLQPPNRVPLKLSTLVISALRPVTFKISLRAVPTAVQILGTVGSIRLQVNPFFTRQRVRASGYFIGLYDVNLHLWLPVDPSALLSPDVTYRVTLTLRGNDIFPSVEGIAPGFAYQCNNEGTHCRVVAGTSGKGHIPVSPGSHKLLISAGPDSNATISAASSAPSPGPGTSTGAGSIRAERIFSSSDLVIYRQPALPALYIAKSVYCDPHPFSDQRMLIAAAKVYRVQDPVVLLGCPRGGMPTLGAARLLSWHRLNPTQLTGRIEGSGRVMFVFSQSYDPSWHLTLNGKTVPVSDHRVVNGFANGWLVNLPTRGKINWELAFSPQTLVFPAEGGAVVIFSSAVLLLAGPRLLRRKGN